MINPTHLLADLRKLVTTLEDDLRERCAASPDLDAKLRAEWQSARDAKRTAETYIAWRDAFLTQVAVAWVLGTVFVRFLEDNSLVDEPWLSGPGERLQRAKDQRTLFFQQNPALSDREYLHGVFRAMQDLPAVRGLFDERHNPLWSVGLSGDGAAALLAFWQRVDPDTGHIAHDFNDAKWDTRFLGDLYQDLSEAVRKRYALLQTPEFVEEFILDRTLTPAIEEFGFKEVRLLDPTCGSGHFLLGAFRRLYDLWVVAEPETNPRELARRALAQVAGVDVNPYAVAIARFRLLIAALRVSGVRKMKDAPAFALNVAAGDSLLHGPRFAATTGPTPDLFEADSIRHVYQVEDRDELARILGRRYHAVVGNPPYITVKDAALNQAYRDRFASCSGKYSLAVPFMERLFELALPRGDGRTAGYVGMITANSFMKREFGKKLIEEHIPRWDLTHVVDTSGAYIPGHGTPTVILFGRNQRPVASTIRTVMGIRGEPSTPEDPARGLVWTAILDQLDRPGSESEYVSVADTERQKFHSHPWSIGGGGAAELKELLDEAADTTLGEIADSIGITSFTLEDDIFLLPRQAALRHRMSGATLREMIVGDAIRDWTVAECDVAVFPYDQEFQPIADDTTAAWNRYLWPGRTCLANNKMFGGKTKVQSGLKWYEFGRLTSDKLRTPLSIAFAFVATHNHFVLDRGGKVFNRSAPVIKLPPGATEDDHLALLGLLNSSIACFWMKQAMHSKGGGGINEGHRGEKWEFFFEMTGTGLAEFPVVETRAGSLARRISSAMERSLAGVAAVGRRPTESLLLDTERSVDEDFERSVFLQEELDWLVYGEFGLLDPQAPSVRSNDEAELRIKPGQRAFEIVMARREQAGGEATTWFSRHGYSPIAELPRDWPDSYKELIERRISIIETDRNLALIERPEFKRRWSRKPWKEQVEVTLASWLLDSLESRCISPAATLSSCATLADFAQQDEEFIQVATLYRERPDFDFAALVADLVESAAVPFLPVLRYKPSGLRKRAAWEQTWALQRREDAGESVGEIPVPPKYTSADFLSGTYWRLRGKLDVPKERFILYPHCERDADPTPVIGWAGWDHLQQARALSAYYVQMKEQEGWPAQRLTPLLAGLLELEPWLLQWHNDIDPDFNIGMGDYFRDYIREEARTLGLTTEEIRGWTPPARSRRMRAKRT